MPGMSKHQQHPPPKTIEPDTDPEPVTRDETPPDPYTAPELRRDLQGPGFTVGGKARVNHEITPEHHANAAARRQEKSDLTTELATLPASNDLVAIQSNVGAGYYANKHDHLVADLTALTFDDPAATAQRDVIVQRLSAGATK
jgi:hypothetical protein